MRQYNLAMDGIDIKDQMVQPYLFERKLAKKWYVKFLKMFLMQQLIMHSWYITVETKCII
jgi:hypothetical protein